MSRKARVTTNSTIPAFAAVAMRSGAVANMGAAATALSHTTGQRKRWDRMLDALAYAAIVALMIGVVIIAATFGGGGR